MAINDFIISTLNVSDDMTFSIDTHKSSDKLHILIKLNDTHPHLSREFYSCNLTR